MLDKIQLTLCLIVIVTVFAITSCTAPSSDIVGRYVDREAGVVCWTYQSGISCLPIDATTLAK